MPTRRGRTYRTWDTRYLLNAAVLRSSQDDRSKCVVGSVVGITFKRVKKPLRSSHDCPEVTTPNDSLSVSNKSLLLRYFTLGRSLKASKIRH